MFGKIKLVFIDIDNTLLDFDEAIINAFKTGFDKFNLGIYNDNVYKTFTEINNGLWRKLEKNEITFEKLKSVRFSMVFEALGIDFDGPTFEKFFRSQLHEVVFPIEGSVELLKYLHSKYIVVLASNGPQQQQVTRVALGGMDKYCDYIFTSEFIGYSKPSYEYFDTCFHLLEKEKIKVDPSECVMIGDSLTSDIFGAKQYGIPTIFFDKHDIYSEIPDSNCDLMVKKLKEILEVLK